MKSPDSLDVAAHCARAALAMMERHKVPPHPENYAIWYAYVAGRNPELSAAIDEILKSGKKFTAKINDQLYERFAVFPHDTVELREVSQRVEDAVGRVLEFLSNANHGTSTYGAALENFSGKLADQKTVAGLSELVADILAETKVMSELNRQLEQRLESSSSEIARLRNHLDDLKREASTDALTQLANRKLFDHSLNLAAVEAKASGAPLSLLMVDIDHFKQFNDTYGHQLGDQVLKLVARSLTEIAQAKDTAARYGGEEFAVILPATSLEKSVEVAEAIRNQLGTKRLTNRRTGQVLGQVTLSIGAAVLRGEDTSDALVHRADEAMYLAKRQGRNRVKSEADLENPIAPPST